MLKSSSMASDSIKQSSFSSSLLDSIYRTIDEQITESNITPSFQEFPTIRSRQIKTEKSLPFQQKIIYPPPDPSFYTLQHSKSERKSVDNRTPKLPPLDPKKNSFGRSTTATPVRTSAKQDGFDSNMSAKRRISRFLNSIFHHRKGKKEKSASENSWISASPWMQKSRSSRCEVDGDRRRGKKMLGINPPWMTPPPTTKNRGREKSEEDDGGKRELESQLSSDLFELDSLTSIGNGQRWKSEG